MRIQFEIREKLQEIIDEIFSSNKWLVNVIEEKEPLKRIVLTDPTFGSRASVEIWKNEIHITTAWSNYTYRIYNDGKVNLCEYIGAYRGLLEQYLLPTITPVHNILDIEVLDTSITGVKRETLRNYGTANLRLRQSQQETYRHRKDVKDHPTVVQDEFIKEGALMPSPTSLEEK
ncbi:MAG: hypothetical protein LUH10_02380 [Tannerellaceae bacterium]|nr:hypothetical protein [Tannerellaceae bacterium]